MRFMSEVVCGCEPTMEEFKFTLALTLPNDSLAPAHSALAGLRLRRMELPLLPSVFPFLPHVAIATCKPFAASRAAQVPRGEGITLVSASDIRRVLTIQSNSELAEWLQFFENGSNVGGHVSSSPGARG